MLKSSFVAIAALASLNVTLGAVIRTTINGRSVTTIVGGSVGDINMSYGNIEFLPNGSVRRSDGLSITGFTGNNMIRGNGVATREERACEPFSSIRLEGSIQVELTTGDSFKCQVTGDGNLVEHVIAEVINDELVLSVRNGVSFTTVNELKALVQVPENGRGLQRMIIKGSGSLRCSDQLSVDTLELRARGSGDFLGTFHCQNLNLKLTGSGEVSLSGTCKNLEAHLSGGGDLQADNLIAENVSISSSGSGDAQIHAKARLDVDSSGTGDIKYRGNPGQKSIYKTGCGSVKPH